MGRLITFREMERLEKEEMVRALIERDPTALLRLRASWLKRTGDEIRRQLDRRP
jgi:hypothetical protein